MAYQALYRKWRPLIFDDVIGQSHITETIRNELLSDKIAHAYLFTGTRGTGKTTTAKIFSRAVNCLNPKDGNPCNECENCKAILSEVCLDVQEIDAASNTGVENIRDIINQVQYAPSMGKYKVYIIDEVHSISESAFNALLKTLEEPPAHVIFILATTEAHRIPATILSRCQRFDFKNIAISDIVENIQKILKGENISADYDALEYVAFLGDGSMRDSLSILDQCLAFKGNNLTVNDVTDVVGAVDDTVLYEFASDIAERDITKALKRFNDCVNSGKNYDNIIKGLLTTLREIIMYKINSDDYSVSSLKKKKLSACADKFDIASLVNYVNILTDCMTSLRSFASQRVICECALIRLVRPEMNSDAQSYKARLEALENKLALIEKKGLAPVSGAVTNEDQPFDDIPLPEPPAEADFSGFPPADAPEATEAPKSGTGGDAASSDVEKVICSWNDVMNVICGENKLTLYSALFKVRLSGEGDDLVIITDDPDLKPLLSSNDNKEYIQNKITAVTGVQINIRIETGKTQAPPETKDVFANLSDVQKQFPVNFKLD